MISMPTWDLFCYKYPTEVQQRERFEDLARILFCIRHGIQCGIFQYANHAGNETATIAVGSDIIGFQAKFFTGKIDGDVIMKSIRTAHENNPRQNKIIIYTNRQFGNPPRGKLKPSVQEKVETEAAALGIDVEWSMNKMILDQVAKNQWVYDVFFDVGPNLSTLVDEERSNTYSILESISNHISVSEKKIKIDRSTIVNDILSNLGKHKHFVIYGEGGIGKTAIIKDVFDKIGNLIPLCIRKAQTLNVDSVSNVFRHANSYRSEQFKDAYVNDNQKIFVIDSAEKLQEIADDGPMRNLISLLDGSGWSIIFTVRTVFVQDLKENLDFVYRIQAREYSVDKISEDYLGKLAISHNIQLPANEFLKQRLTNLFYLGLYAQMSGGGSAMMSYTAFKDRAWKEKIKGKSTERGLSIKRESCFMDIIRERVSKSKFYVKESALDAEALQKLLDDEIVTRNSQGIFISHDIYEEWGLEHFISEIWYDRDSIKGFFENMGTSYLIRRAFRIWLIGCLDSGSDDVNELIKSSLSDELDHIWKDEIIIAVLLSEYAETFIEKSSKTLLEENGLLLNRIVFLLQLACKKHFKSVVVKERDHILYAPDGPGWSAVINFIYQNIDTCSGVKYLIPVLEDWTAYNTTGVATRNSGLIALSILAEYESANNVYFPESKSDKLTQIICNSAKEVRNEIVILIDRIVKNGWTEYRSPYYYFSQFILTKPALSERLITATPKEVILLADAMWKRKPNESKNLWGDYDYHNSEIRYGISESHYGHRHNPAGAMQTPMFWLLTFIPDEAVKFLVEFVNYSINVLSNNAKEHDGIESIVIYNLHGEGRQVVSSMQLWQLYRGAVHTVVPELLQSLHMALEKFLLQILDEGLYSEARRLMAYILDNSDSVSLIAVVSSIVCAYPHLFEDFALSLFSTAELFNYDNLRKSDEELLGFSLGLYAMGNIPVAEERVREAQKSFRKMCLENLCVNYQYTKFESFTDERYSQLITKLHAVIDKLYEEAEHLPLGLKETRLILLYRMDRRKHSPIVTKRDDNSFQIELNPQLPDDVRRHSEEQLSLFSGPMRFVSLLNWTNNFFSSDAKQRSIAKYDKEPSVAVEEMRELETALMNGEYLMPTTSYALQRAAGILMRYYAEKLNAEDREYCKDVIFKTLAHSFQDNYFPQINDGLEACIHSLPSVVCYYPEKNDLILETLMRTALNNHSLGAYKRICDFAFETLLESNWVVSNPEIIDRFIRQYITYSLEIDMAQRRHYQKAKESSETLMPYGLSMGAIIDEIMLKRMQMTWDEIIQCDVSIIPKEYIENIFKLLLLDPNNSRYRTLAQKLSSEVADTLVDHKCVHSHFSRWIQLYQAYADYVLYQPIEMIEDLMSPCIAALNDNSNSEYFLTEFINCEINRPRTSAFWKAWDVLYPAIVREGCYYDSHLVSIYMLTSPYYMECPEWKSLRSIDTWIFSRMSQDCFENPHVIHSIAKSLNYIARGYLCDGINWLYSIIHRKPDLNLKDLEQDTIFYLERVLGQYARANRMMIKGNLSLKEKILTILTFMVERNSTQAYMLRELVA